MIRNLQGVFDTDSKTIKRRLWLLIHAQRRFDQTLFSRFSKVSVKHNFKCILLMSIPDCNFSIIRNLFFRKVGVISCDCFMTKLNVDVDE